MPFTVNHIPTLFVASALTFGGVIPIFNAEYAIREMGIPQRIARSKEAQTIMILGMGRTTTIGLALWTFYLQGKLEVVDTLMLLLGAYIGAIDAYVCWKEGVPGKAWFRVDEFPIVLQDNQSAQGNHIASFACDEGMPQTEGERDAFIRMEPCGFQIRHPPPPHELDDYITPDNQVFHTMHMGVAMIDNSRYQLVIDGLVDRPFAVSLDQLKELPQISITAFHECYGSPLKPPTEALWRVGNVKWTGVRLSYLLGIAGLVSANEERFVWSEGLDRGVFAGVEADRYRKDLPLQKAMRSEVLVAYAMNGESLTRERGGPVRLVVPGYFGTNSTKWLCKLSVHKERAKGPYTTRFYNEIDPGDREQTRKRPVWNVEVNSMITTPKPNAILSGSEIVASGWAWSDVGVETVELSCDEGRTWIKANVQTRYEYGWQHFNARIELAPRRYTIIVRATSVSGEQQPLMGRRNNVHRISITIVSS